MKQGPEAPRDRFEGRTEEDVENLRGMEETILGKEPTPEDQRAAWEGVEHERLRILLTYAFEDLDEALYQSIYEMALHGTEVSDPATLVAENLMAPDDFHMREHLIDSLQNDSRTRKVVQLLREVHRFLLSRDTEADTPSLVSPDS